MRGLHGETRPRCGSNGSARAGLMDVERAKTRLQGCYVTVPTMFRDPDLELDLAATRRNVKFLLGRGLDASNAVLLSGGAAGDFSTMSFAERIRTAEAI